MLESFATNAPDLHYWSVNSCFGAFLSVRLLFGPFRYGTKLGAKRAKLVQLMQTFMPRCRARIFRNERSRSTPLDPNLMFWCVFSMWVHLEPFCYCTKLAAKRTKLVQLMQKFVPRCLVRIFTMNAPDPNHRTLNSCFVVYLSVRVHFGTVSLLHETWCKTRQT